MQLNPLNLQLDKPSIEEARFLDQNGYLSLGPLLSDKQVKTLRKKISKLLEEEGEKAGAELAQSKYIRHPKEKGADRLADLVNKDPEFDLFYTHPRVLGAIAHVLGPWFKLSSLNYRSALPGFGQQKLHVDWHEPVAPGDYKVCNSIWLLDDFTENNGATRLVAGTHLQRQLPEEALDDPESAHPDEQLLIAPAGTVVIFNSHMWHGGTLNRSNRPRQAIHSYFCRRDQPQQIDQLHYLRETTRQRLSREALWILGIDKEL